MLFFTTVLSFAQDDLERKAQSIDKKLIAPCCWAKTIDQEQSREAIEMRDEVRVKLAQGQSEKEILNAFEQRFGERILAEPKAAGFNLTVWFFPLVVLGFGGFLLLRLLKRPAPKEEITDTMTLNTGTPEKDAKYQKMIDDELYRS